MKTTKLLSTFSGKAMRLGPVRHKQSVKEVSIHFFSPRTTTPWGAEYQALRMRFETLTGEAIELDMPLTRAWRFLEWAESESHEGDLVDPSSAQKIRDAYDEVERIGKIGNGFKQARAILKAAGGK